MIKVYRVEPVKSRGVNTTLKAKKTSEPKRQEEISVIKDGDYTIKWYRCWYDQFRIQQEYPIDKNIYLMSLFKDDKLVLNVRYDYRRISDPKGVLKQEVRHFVYSVRYKKMNGNKVEIVKQEELCDEYEPMEVIFKRCEAKAKSTLLEQMEQIS